jgi:4-hydroxybenzoate polyprenyltransferase
LKLIEILINSNLYISFAAVIFTLAAQIQLGIKPQLHVYLVIIFFATLFEYNLHRFITTIKILKLTDTKERKLRYGGLTVYFAMLAFALCGFIVIVFYAKPEVLIVLTPFALITLLYSVPVFKTQKSFMRLREIPFLKIFLISFVWSTATTIIPVIHNESSLFNLSVIATLTERFFFIFAITIPFDIRDMESDLQAGLKTIPLKLDKNKSILISYIALLMFFLISFFHYQSEQQWEILLAITISFIVTFFILYSKKLRTVQYYHTGILDGTIILQGFLVIVIFYISKNF